MLTFNVSDESVKKLFSDIINDLTVKCEERFENLQNNPVFITINILYCRRWLKGANLSRFRENEITESINHFNVLLTKNNYNVDRIMTEWDLLKLLEVWQIIFTSNDKEFYKNVVLIIKLLLITPTMNTKLERMFSRMNRVKTNWRGHLLQEHWENNLHISKDGPYIKDFGPEKAIDRWYNQKVRRVTYCISDFETDSDNDKQ